MDIKTPSNLYTVTRYEGADGTLLEMRPLDRKLAQWYLGEVVVNGGNTIKFRLPGTTLAEALSGWEGALRKVLEHIQAQQVRQALTEGVVGSSRRM